ncbi:MAG: V-type ATP synthase subunit E family protein [Candidatus Thermoplasmatota archaeon]|nr:V-type ATP synthase subunit E family protein [Candidatus Thermoplasmatota archaeon]
MGLEKILEKIQTEGDAEAKRIEAEIQSQADEIIAEARKHIDEKSENAKRETEMQIAAMRIQEISGAELDARKIQMAAEKEVLENAYLECLESMKGISHEKLVASAVARIKREMPDAVRIYSSKADEKLVRSIHGFEYGGNIECAGGAIAENKEGTMRLDYRYETIAAAVWGENLREIAGALFK